MFGNHIEKKEKQDKHILEEIIRFLPAFILELGNLDATLYRRPSYAVVLFIDVSSFTTLTEIYTIAERKGVNTLTDELNLYFTTIIKCVFDEGGEVSKFAGDSIMCIWFCDKNHSTDTALTALRCAFNIHKQCDSFLTKSGTVLNLRTILAINDIELIVTVDEITSNYFIVGKAVDEMILCGENSQNRGVYITGDYWNLIKDRLRLNPQISANNGLTVVQLDADYSKVMEILKQTCLTDISAPCVKKHTSPCYINFLSKLKKFIIPAVMEKIELGEPLLYLSELRQISCCFIKIDFIDYNATSNISIILQLLNQEIIYFDGILIKSTGFDKGWCFLCVFGFPSLAVKNKSRSALLFGLKIQKQIQQMDFIKLCSVGICTGLAYCGVIGHPERHEYTIIGNKVNMSARLMCSYLGIVSCDSETYMNSKFDDSCFEDLPVKKLKGVENPHNIHRFVRIQTEDMQSIQFNDIFLNRKKEILSVCTKISCMSDNEINGAENETECIVYEGEDGSGRTLLLKFLHSILSKVSNIFSFYIKSIRTNHSEKFRSVKLILEVMLKKWEVNIDLKKKWFQDIINRIPIKTNMTHAVLNDILGIRDRNVYEACNYNVISSEYNQILKEVVIATLQTFDKPCILLIDDVHFMDKDSIMFLPVFGSQKNSLVIGTTKPKVFLNDIEKKAALDFLSSLGRQTMLRYLNGFDEKFFVFLVCELTKTTCVMESLIKALHEKARGIPGVLKEVLNELIQKEILFVGDMSESEEIFVSSSMKPKKPKNLVQSIFFSEGDIILANEESRKNSLYCRAGIDLIHISNSLESFYLAQYDSLRACEQTILNNSCILGYTFSRQYLYGICKETISDKEFCNSIEVLMSRQFLACARTITNETKSINRVITCACSDNFSKLAFMCKMFAFGHESIRSALYNKMTHESLHYRRCNAIRWLESNTTYACKACAGWHALQISDGSSVSIKENQLTMHNVVSQVRLKYIEEQLIMNAKYMKYRFPKHNTKLTKKQLIATAWRRYGFEAVCAAIISGKNKQAILPFLTLISEDCFNRSRKAWLFEHFRNTSSYQKIVSFDSYFSVYASYNDANDAINESDKLIYELVEDEQDVFDGLKLYEIVHSVSQKKTLPFASTSLRLCRCSEIIRSVYQELYYHSSQISDLRRETFYAIKLAELYIIVGEPLKASEFIDRAKNLVSMDFKSNRLVLAMYYEVLGSLMYKIGRYDESVINLNKSLRFLGFTVRKESDCLSEIVNEFVRTSSKYVIGICLRVLISLYCSFKYITETTPRKVVVITYALAHASKQVSSEIIRMVIDHYYQSKFYDEAFKMCENKLVVNSMSNKKDTLELGNLYTVVMLICMMNSELEKAIENGFRAKALYEKLKAIDELLYLIPYLTLAILYRQQIDLLSELLNSMENAVENTDESSSSISWNWYYNLSLDLTDTTGLRFSRTLNDLERIVHHNELLKNHDVHSTLYGFSIICSMYARRLDFTNCRKYFRCAVEQMAQKELNTDDPIIQRCLLKLIESQIIYVYFNYSEDIWLIDHVNFINKMSMNYPYYMFLKALSYKLLKHENMLYHKLVEEAINHANSKGLYFHKEWIERNRSVVKASRRTLERKFQDWHSFSLGYGLNYYVIPQKKPNN